MNTLFISEGAQVMYEMAQDLYADGIIDAARMREYDALCFTDTAHPEALRQLERGVNPIVMPHNTTVLP
jgi:hypothetical protein